MPLASPPLRRTAERPLPAEQRRRELIEATRSLAGHPMFGVGCTRRPATLLPVYSVRVPTAT